MVDTSKTEIKDRDLHYYRRRLKNRVFETLCAFYADEAARQSLTKRDIAARLKRDPAQISRWLATPSNLTLESISDLLLALDAEPEPLRIIRFADRPKHNFTHPLIAKLTNTESASPATAKTATAVWVDNRASSSGRSNSRTVTGVAQPISA